MLLLCVSVFAEAEALVEAERDAKQKATAWLDSEEGFFVMDQRAIDTAQEIFETKLHEAYMKKNVGKR